MKLAISVLFIVALAVMTAGNAQAGLVDEQATAVATNLELYGGQPQDIAVDPSDDGQNVYMATYTPNGVFSSNDGGQTWSSLPVAVDYGAGKAITIDPDAGDVYAAIGDDIIKSTNQGSSWTSVTDNLVGERPLVGSAIAWADGTLVVAVDNGAVQVSSDGGDTFTSTTLEAGTRQNAISIVGDDSGTFYAVLIDYDTDLTQIFSSTDHGLTWNAMDVEAGGVTEGSIFYSIAVDPVDANHLVLSSYHPDYDSYHSFDAGASWTVLRNGTFHLGANKAVFDGVGGLYIGIYYTNDASVVVPVWSQITTDTPLSSVQGDIYAVDAVHPTTIFSNTPLGVAKSEDGGSNWIDTVDGIQAVQTFAITQTSDKDTVWLGANGGLAKTSNFTANHPDWEYPILPTESSGSIYAVWVKPSDADYVVTGSSNFFYYTEDGGDTWTQADAPDFLGTVDQIIVSSRDSNTLYGLVLNTSLTEDAYNGAIMKSTDAGKTWEDLSFSTTLANGAIAVANQSDQDVLYVGIGLGGSETGIYTYRAGEWEKIEADFDEFGVNYLLVDPADANTIFASFETASTEGSLYKTLDGGDTWEQITDGLNQTNHLGVMTAQTDETTTLYLAGQDFGGDGMLYKSTDGGDSWSEYYRGKKQEFFYALLFDGLVSGNDRGVFDLKTFGKVALKSHALGTSRYRVTVTLKDAATKQRLANKRVTVYKKPAGHSWQVYKTIKTNSRGKKQFEITARSGGKVKVVWKPKSADRAEYTRSTSRVLTAD